jgi:hypothetical protein
MGSPQRVTFRSNINGDVIRLNCTLAVACHDSQTKPVLKNGTDDATIMANYTAFIEFAMMGANSKIVTYNNGTQAGHTGGAPLQPADSQRWIDWINDGRPLE